MRWLLVISLGLAMPAVAHAQSAMPVAWDIPEHIALSRPDPDGVATPVRVTVFVVDVETIDGVRQRFAADFVVQLRWHDPRISLALADDLVGPGRVDLSDVWHPYVQILNERDLRRLMEDKVEVSTDGTVIHVQRYQGDLASPFVLVDFPFDVESLPITLVSLAYGPDEVEFVVDTVGTSDELSIPSWSIGAGVAAVTTHRVSVTHGSGEAELFARSRFDLRFDARRRLGIYMWKVLVPLSVIVLMSWAVFWIEPDHIGARVGVATTSILTLVVFLFSLGRVMPPVSYLTRIDHLFYRSLALVFLAFVVTNASAALSARGKYRVGAWLDRASRGVFPVLFALAVMAFWR